jgi:sugar lactone lactonase YvrE
LPSAGEVAPETVALECVVHAGNHLGETPLWSVVEQALYWINCEKPPRLYRYDRSGGEVTTWDLPQRIGGVVLREGGGLVVALADGLYSFDPASGACRPIAANPCAARAALHECQTDRAGKIWVGGRAHDLAQPSLTPGGGALFRLGLGGLEARLGDVSCANGLAFSLDGDTLFFSMAPGEPVKAYAVDPLTGRLSKARTFIDLPAELGFLDGATVDAEGCYWSALAFGGALRRYRPDGSLDRVIALPFAAPTKVAFGGSDLHELYITTTRIGHGGPQPGDAMNGGLYRFCPGVRGVAERPAKIA